MNSKLIRSILAPVFVLGMVLVVTSAALAASPIYVRPGGDDTNCNGTVDVDYPGSGGPGLACAVKTIQKGIDLVDGGGAVFVRAGTYSENVILNKQINLYGNQQGVDARGRVATESIVTPAVPANRTVGLVTGSAGSVIDGFTFSGGTRAIESSSGPLNNLQILNNRIISFTSAGIFLNDPGTDITINRNVVDGSSKVGTGGIVHLDTDTFSGFYLTNNDIVDGATGTGFFVDGNHNVGPSGTRTPLISGNLVDNNGTGMNLGTRAFGSQSTPNAGTIITNTFSNNAFDGLQGGMQNVLITRNTFTGNDRWGLALTSFGNTGADRGAQNSVVSENFFSGNTGLVPSGDLLFSSSQAVGTISTNKAFNNSFGSALAVSYSGTELIQTSGNWWGAASNPEFIAGLIGGTGAANIDYSPWLNSGTDTNLGAAGFQGDFSTLNVDDDSPHSTVAYGPLLVIPAGRVQEGVDLVSGSIVNVLSGNYPELVTVNKTVTLLGAQNGVDGRTRCDATSGESMMNGSQGAFNVQADDVVIDGFVIENSTNTTYLGTGLYLPASYSGYQIRNNIFRNNIFGLFLNSSGVKASVVEKNCFKTNNVTGPAGGNGIYSEFGLVKTAISDNYFTGHENTAILLTGYSAAGGARNVQIMGNEFRQDNRIRLTYASDILISGNTNVDSVVHGVQIAGGSKNITITGNIMTGALFAAVRVADSDGVGPNRNVVILNNKMNRNAYGLWVGAGALDGPLTARFNEMISNTVAVTTQTSLAGVSMAIERNNISLNTVNGMQNSGGPTLDGRCNWWGAADGPGPVGPGSGNTVSTNVNFAPFLLTSDLNGPCVPSIKVVKVVVGDPPATPWQFSGTGAMGAFTLPVAGGVKSFFDLGAGNFTISETPNPAYSSAVSCSNGATGGSSVNVTIGATDSISCTFTNTRQMVNITIVKQSAPQSPTNFRFTGSYQGGGSGSDSQSSIGDFYLDDPASNDGDAYGNSKSFGVPRGAVYSFGEPAVSGWYLTSITCNPAASATVNLATRSVTINTSSGNDVTCTFKNEQAAVLTVRKYRESNGIAGQQAPEAFLSTWTIQVKMPSPTSTLVSQAATNALGKVSFSLKPGSYQVCEVQKSGWTQKVPAGNACYNVTLSGGQALQKDFGNCPNTSCPGNVVFPGSAEGGAVQEDAPVVFMPDDLDAWVEGWLQTPDGPVEQEGGELIEPDAGLRLYLPLVTN